MRPHLFCEEKQQFHGNQEAIWDMDTFLGLWGFFNDQVKE